MNKKGNTLGVVLVSFGVIALIGLMFFGWIAGSYNTLVNKDVSVENSWAKVQTAYERRADLIPNLVETVKGVSNFEKDTQTQIAMFRSGVKNAETPEQLDKVGKQMNSFVSDIIVSIEAYPNLKSNENFLALQDELAGTENRVKFERDNFNDAVKEYKIQVRKFPTSIIAGMFGFEQSKWNMFEVSEGSEEAPKVSFK
jgi:LemA protein